MFDDESTSEEAEGPRRTTFQPPAENSEALEPVAFVVNDAPSDVSSEEARPASAGYLPAPVRESLSEAEIFARFSAEGTTATADMIIELEKQVTLKLDEEEAFESWMEIIRATREHDAEAIIDYEREIFDGGSPAPLVLPEAPEPQPEPETEAPEELADDSAQQLASTEAEISSDETDSEGVGSESIDAAEELVPTEEAASEEVVPPQSVEEPLEESAPETTGEDSAEDSAEVSPPEQAPKTGEHWPLEQAATETVVAPAGIEVASSHAGVGVLTRTFSWLVALVPLVAISAGSFLVFQGLGVLEVAAAMALAGVIAALAVGQFSRASSLSGASADIHGVSHLGRVGRPLLGGLALVLRSVLATVLVILTATVLVDIIDESGFWTLVPWDFWILRAIAGAIVVGAVAALAALGGTVLRVAMFASGGLGLLGSLALIVLALPGLDMSMTLSWEGEYMPVVAAASFLLAGLLLLLGVVAEDHSQLAATDSPSRAPGLISALVSVVPLSALVIFVSWWADSSPLTGLSLVADPVGAVVSDLPTWFPLPALAFLALPLLGLAALALHSAGAGVSLVGIPGQARHHSLALGVVIAGVLAALIATDFSVISVLPDLVYTLGVVVAAWAGTMVLTSLFSASRTNHHIPAVRLAPLLAALLGLGAGLGLVSSSVPWLSWQGYLFPLGEQAGLMDLSPAQPGVLVAFVLAALVSLLGELVTRATASSSKDSMSPSHDS
ncbi:hypothetical protein N9J31_01890 [Pontimonas sp.]|nr:hypothetical protein [Pontimonas sp.]MDA9114602.1 hypothetical protein [Pontimonas sp.]